MYDIPCTLLLVLGSAGSTGVLGLIGGIGSSGGVGGYNQVEDKQLINNTTVYFKRTTSNDWQAIIFDI